jgi:uncharacterized caspase-like protein
MIGFLRSGFAALLLLAMALPCQAEKRIALVIGNSGYQNATRLPNPANDAASMADLFKKAGFDVVSSRKDLGNLEFKRALREFTALAATADIAVVFYAGHGIEAKGSNYLLPVDVKLANEYDAEDEAIPLSRVIETIEPAKRLRLIILDACRDNPFNRTMQRSIATRSMSTGLAAISEPSTDTLIAYAAKAGSTAADGDTQHSPFTRRCSTTSRPRVSICAWRSGACATT